MEGSARQQSASVVNGMGDSLPSDSDLLEALLDSSNAILAIFDRAGSIVRVNVAFEQVIGFAPDEVLGRSIWSLAIPAERQDWRADIIGGFASEQADRTQWRWQLKNGQERIISWATWPVRDRDGRIAFRVGTGFDVTEQRQTQRRASELAQIVENLGEAIIRTDDQFNIQYCNPAAETLYGYRLEDLRGRPASVLRTPEEFERLRAFGRLLRETGAPQRIETVRLGKDGSVVPVELRVSPLRDENGQIGGWVSITHDISERKKLEAELARQASTDALTGLANRYKFMSVAATEIVRATRSNRPLSLILADLDHFKQVNDKYGHAAGDAALVHFCDVCREELRNVLDLPARLGGEEFAVLLPETHLSNARLVAERLRQRIAASPVWHEDLEFVITCSFGVSAWARGETEVAEAIERADTALYRAKNEGRNRVVSG
jgi:diguanylate cyclase (GGDEF)-like protein/PAS domain S-box-containing protein